MSNAYGFDFLRTDHRLDDDGQPIQDEPVLSTEPPSSAFANEVDFAAAEAKPDLEKQFDILAFLKDHRGSGCLGSGCLGSNVIYRATGIDLDENPAVAEMLQRNPKVRTEMVPDPENPALTVATYAFQAKYSQVRDRTTLLAQINRMPHGIPMRDLVDSYNTVESDMKALITAGDVLAVQNSEGKDKILFPRGDAFLVELDGLVTLEDRVDGGAFPTGNGHKKTNGHRGNGHGGGADGNNSYGHNRDVFIVNTDIDPVRQIRRGEAVCVGGQWFRVSSAVKEGPLEDQPTRAQAPLSVTSRTDLSKRNEVDGYIRPLSSKQLPLDAALSDRAKQNLAECRAAREKLLKLAHGRSGGVAGQLLGTTAHASNPTTLAASFASGPGSGVMRRRPAAAAAASIKSDKAPSSSAAGGGGGAGHHAPQTASSAVADRNALQKAASNPALSLYSHARRHGCTKDVREMYLQTRSLVPESDADLHAALLEHKLLEPGEEMRRKKLRTRANVDNDGKPKKRRYYERKNQRMTNTHLEGTEIGAILARAAEKQKQGKSVGDGGM